MKEENQVDYPDEVIDSLIQHDKLQQAMGLKAFSDYELKHYADEILNAKMIGSMAGQGGIAPMPSGSMMPPIAGFQGNSVLPNASGMHGTSGYFETDPMQRLDSRGQVPARNPHPEWDNGVGRV